MIFQHKPEITKERWVPSTSNFFTCKQKKNHPKPKQKATRRCDEVQRDDGEKSELGLGLQFVWQRCTELSLVRHGPAVVSQVFTGRTCLRHQCQACGMLWIELGLKRNWWKRHCRGSIPCVHHRNIRACLLQMMGISAWTQKLITNLILSLPGRTALNSLTSPWWRSSALLFFSTMPHPESSHRVRKARETKAFLF